MWQKIIFSKDPPKSGKTFFNGDLPTAFEQALAYAGEGGRVATLPEIVQARIIAPKGDHVWECSLTANSGEYIGRSRKGDKVYIVAHGVGPFSKPARIGQAIMKGISCGAGRITQDELYALLEQDGDGNVTVLDFDKVKESASGKILVEDARINALVRARLGESADAYLDQFKKVYGDRIFFGHTSDSLYDNELTGRILRTWDRYGIETQRSLEHNACFIGIRSGGGNKNYRPSPDQLLSVSRDYVVPALRPEFDKSLTLEEALAVAKSIIAPCLMPEFEKRLREVYE